MRLLSDFFVLCLLLSFVNTCICSSRKTVVLFKGGETKVPFEENNGTKTILTPRAFRIPAFVGGMINNKKFLAVICDVRYASYSDWSFIEIVTKKSYEEYHTWSDAEIFLKNTRKSRAHYSVGYVTGVMNKNKIYVLASSWDESKVLWTRHGSETGWDPLLVVGTVMNRTDSNSDDVFVKWEEKRSLKGILPKLVNWSPTSQYIGGIGNGVVTRNGTIIFPVQISNNMHQVAASIMYSTGDGLNWKMGGTTPAGLTESSVVEWNDGKLILFTRYDCGHRKAYESEDMGETWKESLMFSRVWGNEPDRRGVGSQGSAITVLVDTEEMLLFSHPLNSDEYYARDTLQLWMSDGQRIMCVGTISEKGKGESYGHSILAHVGDNLYIVLEINPYGNWRLSTDSLKQWDRVIVLSPLTQFFTRAKKTVREWRELDRRLQAKGIPTNGLVGFLSKSNNVAVWPDMYKCVNANVNGATRVDSGFRFAQAPGSGAQWPVQSQGQNQLYTFAEKQFTLAAIVMIHHTDETGQFSLLGASLRALLCNWLFLLSMLLCLFFFIFFALRFRCPAAAVRHFECGRRLRIGTGSVWRWPTYMFPHTISLLLELIEQMLRCAIIEEICLREIYLLGGVQSGAWLTKTTQIL